MKKFIFENKKKIFGLLITVLPFVVIAILKLYLISGQSLYAIGDASYDDQLFIRQASNLLDLKWLGPYDSLTLAKGPFYPMWIALTHAFFHFPLFYSQHLLYIFACIVLAISLKPLYGKVWPRFFIFVLVLFNPISFSDGPTTRVIREGIYQPLTLLFVGLFIGLMLRIKSNQKNSNLLIWSIFTGIVLSALWLTREEGVWLLPFVLLFSIYLIYLTKNGKLKYKIFICFVPLLILFFSVTLISTINYFYYKSFYVTEFNSSEFLSAYGSLTRVKGDKWLADVPVSTSQRLKIYEVSPLFRELKPYIENLVIPENEIKGGWFVWIFKSAVTKAGYYSNGEKTLNYYKSLAEEINNLCENKKLDCNPRRKSMIPPWNSNYNIPFIITLFQSVDYVLSLKDINAMPSTSLGHEENLQFFKRIANSALSEGKINNRIKALAIIGNAYQLFIPGFLITGFIFIIVSIFRKKNWKNESIAICIFLLILVFSRLVFLSIGQATSFPMINIVYLSPVYPVAILFTVISIYSLLNWIRNIKRLNIY